jgi:hypothetical protein
MEYAGADPAMPMMTESKSPRTPERSWFSDSVCVVCGASFTTTYFLIGSITFKVGMGVENLPEV